MATVLIRYFTIVWQSNLLESEDPATRGHARNAGDVRLVPAVLNIRINSRSGKHADITIPGSWYCPVASSLDELCHTHAATTVRPCLPSSIRHAAPRDHQTCSYSDWTPSAPTRLPCWKITKSEDRGFESGSCGFDF